MPTMQGLNNLFKKLEEFAKEACRLKLVELFPDQEASDIEAMGKKFLPACICIKSAVTVASSFDSNVIVTTAGKQLLDPTNQILAMEAYCYKLSQVIEMHYREIAEGELDAADFYNHIQNGQGES